MNQFDAITTITRKIEDALGIPLYLVGGAVRDTLLSRDVKDWDFATSALPDEIEAAVRKFGAKPYLIGKRFGTIGFKFPFDGSIRGFKYIEITTFRAEEYVEGSRKPSVRFSEDIIEDLSRRDFTINAIAMNSHGKLYDPFNGREDCTSEIIRAVGNPTIRFKEDPLRILRAIRFAAKYDFQIEVQTHKKLSEKRVSLLSVSKERWADELDKILSLDDPTTGLNLLMESKLMQILIPELVLQYKYNQNTPYHDFDLWTHTLKVVQATPSDNLNLRWAALLHDVAKPMTRSEKNENQSNYILHDIVGAEVALKICRYLRFSNERTDYITNAIKNHLHPDSDLKEFDDKGKRNNILI